MDKVLREVLEFCNHSISLFVEAGRAATGSVGISTGGHAWGSVSVLVRPMWQVCFLFSFTSACVRVRQSYFRGKIRSRPSRDSSTAGKHSAQSAPGILTCEAPENQPLIWGGCSCEAAQTCAAWVPSRAASFKPRSTQATERPCAGCGWACSVSKVRTVSARSG